MLALAHALACTYKGLCCRYIQYAMQTLMERKVTKQVRLTTSEATRLAALARALKVSESEILRGGIDEARAGLHRLEARRRNIHLLVQMAKEVPGRKIPFQAK